VWQLVLPHMPDAIALDARGDTLFAVAPTLRNCSDSAHRGVLTVHRLLAGAPPELVETVVLGWCGDHA
jgi:hypothetical protein